MPALADVMAPRRLMLLGSVGAALANAGLVLADGPLLATPLRFATGAFLAAVYPPALKEMATWFRRGRGTALGVLVGALTVGSAAPHLVNALGGRELATGRRRDQRPDRGGRSGGRARRSGRAVPLPPDVVRREAGPAGVRQPRGAPRDARLLRAHVGAERDVGVDPRLPHGHHPLGRGMRQAAQKR